jgi:hypothetical protein
MIDTSVGFTIQVGAPDHVTLPILATVLLVAVVLLGPYFATAAAVGGPQVPTKAAGFATADGSHVYICEHHTLRVFLDEAPMSTKLSCGVRFVLLQVLDPCQEELDKLHMCSNFLTGGVRGGGGGGKGV